MKLDIRLSCTLEEFLTPGFVEIVFEAHKVTEVVLTDREGDIYGDDDEEYRAWHREDHPVELQQGDTGLPSELFDLLRVSPDLGYKPDKDTWVGVATEHADAALSRACLKWAQSKLVAQNIAEFNQ